ncbi:MAG: isoaspartyl peptidase/L-asparaginase [Acidobacteria bacterium]|jgi:beta-aspartyl-peptidase (threonine type)|nr:MAG: isoaspartyl peptidase/L-asparaginase [Acidobacteriota bacterium]GIU83125.1 MAG: isoaspartyl peptidase/L-asparaginase [Pyrinomonadaceae bacterium]
MKQIFSSILAVIVLFMSTLAQKTYPGSELKQLQSPQNPRIGFVIHGGAGVISRGSLTPEKEAEYRKKLEEAVMAGYRALQEGKTALEAVELAIRILEDSPLFNAGKGAVFNAEGKNELDASIMDGKTLKAGAVAAVQRIKNPISLARLVMEKSPHVLLVGEGAERFAVKQGMELVDPQYFWTKERWEQYLKMKKEREEKTVNMLGMPEVQQKYGTVGAVALDKYGNLAAGTSTGGMNYKMVGRVGDTPIIGAGTYANNETCAVSATGWGEYFIRLNVARDVSALMEYRALPIQQATDLVIQQKLKKLGGDGGVIAIDKFGNIGISFNTEGMYRAYINSEGKPVVMIYKDE